MKEPLRLEPHPHTPNNPLPRLVSRATGERILIWEKAPKTKNDSPRNDWILQVHSRLFINQAQDYFLVCLYHILIQMVILVA